MPFLPFDAIVTSLLRICSLADAEPLSDPRWKDLSDLGVWLSTVIRGIFFAFEGPIVINIHHIIEETELIGGSYDFFLEKATRRFNCHQL